MYDAFVDLEKAYDKVCREELWRVLHECGMSSLYDGSRGCVRLGSRVEEYFEVRRGLRQGCVMFPWLINIFFHRVVRQVNEGAAGVGINYLGVMISTEVDMGEEVRLREER